MSKRKQAVKTPEIRVYDSILYCEIKALCAFIYDTEDTAISPETADMREIAEQRIKNVTLDILKTVQPDEYGNRRCLLCSDKRYYNEEEVPLSLSKYGILQIEYWHKLQLLVEPLDQPTAVTVSKEQRAVANLRKALNQNIETLIVLIKDENEFGYGETYCTGDNGLLGEFIASRFTADKQVIDELNLINLKRKIEAKLKKLATYNDHYLRFDEFATRLAEMFAPYCKSKWGTADKECMSIFAEYPEIISRQGVIVHKRLFREINSLFDEYYETLKRFVTSRESEYFVELPSVGYTRKLMNMGYESHNALEKFAHNFASSLRSKKYSAKLIGTDDLADQRFRAISRKLDKIEETISYYCNPYHSYFCGPKIIHSIQLTMKYKAENQEYSAAAFKKAFMENCQELGFILPDSEYGQALLPGAEKQLRQMLATIEKLQRLLLSSDNPEFLEWLCMQNAISKTQLKNRMNKLSQKKAA